VPKCSYVFHLADIIVRQNVGRPITMRASTTKPPAFASFSRLVIVIAHLAMTIFAMAMFFGIVIAQPAAAQGLNFVAGQSSSHPARATSFAWLSSAISISPLGSPMNHSDTFNGESVFRVTENFPSRNLATLVPYQETKTSFVTEVHVPVAEFRLPGAQLRSSNVRFGFFMQTLHNSNVALGPLVATQALHSFSQPRSDSLYGVGVSIPLGKQSHADSSQSLPWAALQRFIHDR
jgi:hypothetical protein